VGVSGAQTPHQVAYIYRKPRNTMTITWTFKPGTSDMITLTIKYLPELDKHELKGGGFLDTNSNTAYVNWSTYRQFDQADIKARKDAYGRLVRLSKGGGVKLGNQIINLSRN
jgi:hypothetical protein